MTNGSKDERYNETPQRAVDLFLCVLILPFALVPMFIIALCIWWGDGLPILFRQIRIGRDLQTFRILKFRTMYVDPDRATGDLTPETGRLANARMAFQTASESDPRITPIGSVLRKTHLDELPQLINVLTGHMSFVGVRPDVPVQEADYTAEEWRERHILRPGLTGISQINVEANLYGDIRKKMDLEWVGTASLMIYFRILFQTFKKLLSRSGV